MNLILPNKCLSNTYNIVKSRMIVFKLNQRSMLPTGARVEEIRSGFSCLFDHRF